MLTIFKRDISVAEASKIFDFMSELVITVWNYKAKQGQDDKEV